jgi:hypothetical protein
MASVELKIDSQNLINKQLTPLDVELAAITIDIFYLICVRKEHFSSDPLAKYEVELQRISYNTPLTLLAYFKNVSVGTAKHVFEMITYYPQEKEKRELANAEKKLDLLEKARALRKRLIKDGIPSDEATKMIAEVLATHKATLEISGPQKEPERQTVTV